MGSSTSVQTVVGESASFISSGLVRIRSTPLYLLWAASAIPTPRSPGSIDLSSGVWVSISKNFDKTGACGRRALIILYAGRIILIRFRSAVRAIAFAGAMLLALAGAMVIPVSHTDNGRRIFCMARRPEANALRTATEWRASGAQCAMARTGAAASCMELLLRILLS